MALTVGTAGHIDHGKTWLVRALTGKDTDRLPEEQRRGISIDLGYAPLELPDGRRLSLIDVPGHERFVRTMVAGATGIDLFLLVIDAAEGARPQTLEHLAILRLLGVERGRRRRDEGRPRRRGDARDRGSRRRASSSREPRSSPSAPRPARGSTSSGRRSPGSADAAPARDAGGPARLYVDRVFTLRGIGTVVTGTLWSGTIAEGDTLRVAPRGGEVRVRSVQVHDAPVRARDRRRARRARPAGRRAARAPPRRRARGAGRVPGLVPARRRARGAGPDRQRRARLRASRHVAHPGPGRPRRRAHGAAAARGSRRRGARRSRRACGGRRRSAARPCSIPLRRAGSRRSGSSSSSRAIPPRSSRRPSRRPSPSSRSRRAGCSRRPSSRRGSRR